jgi:hypothetical protein
MDIVFLVIFFTLVGGAVGFSYGFKFAQEQIMTELTDMVLENIVELKHEVVDNQHFLYYVEHDKFAAQGSTLDDAARNFSIADKSVGRVLTSLGTTVFIVDGKIETE